MGDGVQKTHVGNVSVRADFNKEDFTNIIVQKGRAVVHEKALVCPCKAATSNQLSSCKNCGGTGYVFVNPKKTRMIISRMKINPQLAPWSEEWRGTVNISANPETELSYMDRITVIDANALLSEALFLTKSEDETFWFTRLTYAPKDLELKYVGLFVNATTPLTKLAHGTDYEIDGNYLKVINLDLIPDGAEDREVSLTTRYSYSPVYHVKDMDRESMETFEMKLDGGEVLKHLPLSALAQKAHNVFKDKISLSGETLLNNNYAESVCGQVDDLSTVCYDTPNTTEAMSEIKYQPIFKTIESGDEKNFYQTPTIQDKIFIFAREGVIQFYPGQYTYDAGLGKVIPVIPFEEGERLSFYILTAR